MMRFSSKKCFFLILLIIAQFAAAPRSSQANVSTATVPSAHSEPFGVPTIPASEGKLWRLWRDMQVNVAEDMQILSVCRRAPQTCPSAGALQLHAIVDAARQRQGIGRLGEVNRAVNLAIRPQPEPTWTAPIETFEAGAGDCKNYVLAKYVALRATGLADKDLRIVIVRDIKVEEDHAVLAARINGHWIILDNRWLALAEDIAFPRYTPLFAINGEGVRRFVGG